MLRSIGKQSAESVESVLKKRKAAVGRICGKGRCYAISVVSSASQNLQYLYVKDDVLISDECSYLFCVLYCKHRVHICHYYIGLLFLTVNCFNITILVLCCPDWFWLGLVFFSTESRHWLGRTSPKWPILCLVGRKTLLNQPTEI